MLDPQTHTAIVVLVNSLPLFDVTNVIGHLLLETIIGEESTDWLQLAQSVKDKNLGLYDFYTAAVEKKKTNAALSFPLKHYEGNYWTKEKVSSRFWSVFYYPVLSFSHPVCFK